jgi:hypothetical protein
VGREAGEACKAKENVRQSRARSCSRRSCKAFVAVEDPGEGEKATRSEDEETEERKEDDDDDRQVKTKYCCGLLMENTRQNNKMMEATDKPKTRKPSNPIPSKAEKRRNTTTSFSPTLPTTRQQWWA